MHAVDLYDSPICQDNPELQLQRLGWAASPPAIVQVIEPSSGEIWDAPYYAAGYVQEYEITLNEVEGGEHTERYVSTNGAVLQSPRGGAAPAVSELGNSLPEKLEKIKETFGIGMKHLAAALGVKRPTAYAWVKGERLPQPKRWERVQDLLEMADYWRGLSEYPLSRRAFAPTSSGHSVMELLSAAVLDNDNIKEALKELAAEENARAARLREKAVAMRERMKAKGAKPLPDDVVDQTMRNLSGW